MIQTLTQKRAEILGQIKAYEAQIAQAKHDLAHVNATIELFAAPERQRVRYMVSHGFFKKGEIADICVRHLDVDGEMPDGTRKRAKLFSGFLSHYLIRDRYGRPGKGNDKGNVEGLVGYARRNFMVPTSPGFPSGR